MTNARRPKLPPLKAQIWTYLLLLVASIFSFVFASVADAQPASPAAAPVNASIDITKCQDLKNDQTNFRNEIIKRVRAAATQGQKPALSYELQSPQDRGANTEAKQIDIRASSEADIAVRTLFAAIANPSNPASGASNELTHDPNRRSTIEMYTRCPGQSGTPKQIVQNQNYFVGERGTCPGAATPIDMGMNVTQIFETNMKASAVKNRFAQSKITSSDGDQVTLCLPPQTDCQSGASYQFLPSSFDMSKFPDPKATYYIQDSVTLRSSNPLFSIFAGTTVNRTALRMGPISVCGSTVYLVTGFGYGNEKGFDRTSLIGVIAPVGGKTVVIGQASVESFDSSSWAISFAKDYYRETISRVFGSVDPETGKTNGGYSTIAKLIGSTERPLMGEVGGSPNMTYAAGPTAAVRPLTQ